MNQVNDGDIDAKFKRGMSQSVTGGVLDREGCVHQTCPLPPPPPSFDRDSKLWQQRSE